MVGLSCNPSFILWAWRGITVGCAEVAVIEFGLGYFGFYNGEETRVFLGFEGRYLTRVVSVEVSVEEPCPECVADFGFPPEEEGEHEQRYPWIARSGSLRPVGETLAPLMEGPLPEEGEIGESKRIGSGLGQWVRGQLIRNPSMAVSESGYGSKRSDLRLLLGVMGAPVAPVHTGYKCGGIHHGSVHTQPRVRLSPCAKQIKQKNI